MSDPLSKYIEAAAGFTQLTKSKAEQIVRSLRDQGLTATGNAQEVVDDLLERSEENRNAVLALVRSETKRLVKAMGLASSSDVERLQRQLAEVRRKLAEAEAQARAGDAPDASEQAGSTSRAAAKKTAAKKTAGKAGGKAGGKTSGSASKKTSGSKGSKTSGKSKS